jgi:tetratricopeptide (TPR) repeat protein
MQAYRGYLHLYRDLSLVPVYWNLAADIAKKAGNDQRFAHHAIGCAWALLLLNQEAKAADLFAEVESVLASGPKLHGLRMRLQLDVGVLAMVRQDWREAEARFSDSLDQALQLDIFRRLWRIEANLANLYEILGSVDRCMSYDRRAIQGILVRARAEESMEEKAPWLRQRHALPVLNVAMRAHSGFVGSKGLLDLFTRPQQAEINRLKDLVLKDRLSEIPNDLGWHCKTLASRKRFIVTE